MWNDDIAYAMTFSKYFTVPIGSWPLEEFNTFTLVRFIIALCVSCTVASMSYLNVYYDCSDIDEKLDSLMLALCNVIGILKLSMFRIYADNLICNYSSAINDYLAINTEEKRTIMRQHALMGRMVFYCVVSFGFIAAFGLILSPIMASDENIQVNLSMSKYASRYPLPSTCTLGYYHVSTKLYLVIFVAQCILLTHASFNFVGNDSLFLGISLHVCGQMEILRIDFSNLGLESKNVYEDFLKLTMRHRHLLNHAQLLANTISFVLLVQLLISSVLICTIGFQFILALKIGDLVMTAKTTMVLLTFLSQLFAYSVVGDYLRHQTTEVASSIYCCDWNCVSTKLMRNILFIIMRSQQPVSFIAGKYLIVNLETYMMILKTSFSYLSVLRVMLDT